jgi:hypothetical protein
MFKIEFYDFSFKILLNNGEDVWLQKNKSSAAKIRRKLALICNKRKYSDTRL